jgi:soluble lytic murein transglycosylase-like protein
MRRMPGLIFLVVTVLLAFLAGALLIPRGDRSSSLLVSGVSVDDRLASLRMRVAAVERENQNLQTEVRVRQTLAKHGRRLSSAETERVVASILEARDRYGISSEVLLAVIETESGFNTRAMSNKGALGLMQLMPATGHEMARDLDIEWKGKEMLYDPAINIRLGSEYLHRMFQRFGHADNALAAYNAGPARVEDLNDAGILPRDYPGKVREGQRRYAPR